MTIRASVAMCTNEDGEGTVSEAGGLEEPPPEVGGPLSTSEGVRMENHAPCVTPIISRNLDVANRARLPVLEPGGLGIGKRSGVRLKIGASAHAFTNKVGHTALTGNTQVCTPIQAPSRDKPFVQAHSDVKAQTSKPAYPVHAVSLDALLDIDQHPVVDPEGLSHKTGGRRRAAAGTETHSDMEGLGCDSGILDEEEFKRDKHHSMRTRCTHCPRKY